MTSGIQQGRSRAHTRLRLATLALLPLLGGCAAGTRLELDSMYSEALGRRMPFSLYLPPGYDPSRTYPVVYFLHGMGDDHRALERFGGVAVLDELITAGELPAFILVAPRGERGFYINYHDRTFLYEDYIIDEVIPTVERRLKRGRIDRSQRFVLGISMGGYGAVNLATRHPGLFAAVAALSAPMFSEDEISSFMDVWWKRLLGIHRLFSDGSDRSFLRRNSPRARVETATGALRGLRVFLLNTEQDLDNVAQNNRRFAALLEQSGIPVRHVEVAGRHKWTAWNPHLGAALRYLLVGDE